MGRLGTLHAIRGCPPPASAPLVPRILAGLAHSEGRGLNRLSVSPAILRTIKEGIRKKKWELRKKRAVWLTSCFLFHGSMRAGECLTRSPASFRPSSTLYPRDVSICTDTVEGKRVRYLRIKIKDPKTGLGSSFCEMMEQKNLFFCPLAAFQKYCKVWGRDLKSDLPLIRRPDGLSYTRKAFNEVSNVS